jgi:hypothetical protein
LKNFAEAAAGPIIAIVVIILVVIAVIAVAVIARSQGLLCFAGECFYNIQPGWRNRYLKLLDNCISSSVVDTK